MEDDSSSPESLPDITDKPKQPLNYNKRFNQTNGSYANNAGGGMYPAMNTSMPGRLYCQRPVLPQTHPTDLDLGDQCIAGGIPANTKFYQQAPFPMTSRINQHEQPVDYHHNPYACLPSDIFTPIPLPQHLRPHPSNMMMPINPNRLYPQVINKRINSDLPFNGTREHHPPKMLKSYSEDIVLPDWIDEGPINEDDWLARDLKPNHSAHPDKSDSLAGSSMASLPQQPYIKDMISMTIGEMEREHSLAKSFVKHARVFAATFDEFKPLEGVSRAEKSDAVQHVMKTYLCSNKAHEYDEYLLKQAKFVKHRPQFSNKFIKWSHENTFEHNFDTVTPSNFKSMSSFKKYSWLPDQMGLAAGHLIRTKHNFITTAAKMGRQVSDIIEFYYKKKAIIKQIKSEMEQASQSPKSLRALQSSVIKNSVKQEPRAELQDQDEIYTKFENQSNSFLV